MPYIDMSLDNSAMCTPVTEHMQNSKTHVNSLNSENDANEDDKYIDEYKIVKQQYVSLLKTN